MKELSVKEFSNVFDKIGKEWMLVSASNSGKTNTMTASWGGLGVLWNKNVAFVFIRPQRYTKTFIDSSEYLSLSFFDESYRDVLRYMGRVSGRDEDKIKKQNLTLLDEIAPCFKEANVTLICKKLYAQELVKEGFIESKLLDANYKDGDYHTMYVVEIQKILLG